jgi:hypothetical protein
VLLRLPWTTFSENRQRIFLKSVKELALLASENPSLSWVRTRAGGRHGKSLIIDVFEESVRLRLLGEGQTRWPLSVGS